MAYLIEGESISSHPVSLTLLLEKRLQLRLKCPTIQLQNEDIFTFFSHI